MLDNLEQRAADAAAGMQSLESWHPAAADDAVPPELADRAARVLASQGRAIAELRAREQQIRSQLLSLGTSAPGSSSDVPVYLDAIG